MKIASPNSFATNCFKPKGTAATKEVPSFEPRTDICELNSHKDMGGAGGAIGALGGLWLGAAVGGPVGVIGGAALGYHYLNMGSNLANTVVGGVAGAITGPFICAALGAVVLGAIGSSAENS